MVPGHEDAIFELCVLSDGRLLSGGGRDGYVIEWTPDYEKTDSNTDGAAIKVNLFNF